jgi:hypothetical protein
VGVVSAFPHGRWRALWGGFYMLRRSLRLAVTDRGYRLLRLRQARICFRVIRKALDPRVK